MDRSLPVEPGQRLPLRVGYRNDGGVRKRLVKRNEVRQVEPAVHGRDVRYVQPPQKGKMLVVEVEMDHVEVLGLPGDLLDLDGIVDVRYDVIVASPERLLTRRHQAGGR